jgi:prepilin-type N-terminal cleavage/methylation domain-containing protein
MMKTDAKRYRFTLIELLIVIAIIAILAAMLMPALARSRALAKTLVCAGNQRSIAQVVMLWAGDHGRELIPYNTSHTISVPINGRTFWTGDTIGTKKNLAHAYHADYFSEGRILYCPLQENPNWQYQTYADFPTPASPLGSGQANKIRVGYNYNPWREDSSSRTARYQKLSDIDADCVLSVDMVTQLDLFPDAAPHLPAPSITYSRGDGSVVTNKSQSLQVQILSIGGANFSRMYSFLEALVE